MDRRAFVRTGFAVSTLATLGGMPSLLRAAGPAAFDPVAFFTGRTEGSGTLDEVMASPRAVRVSSIGTLRAGGLFVMDQTVDIAGDPTKRRQWQLRQAVPGRFTGTISDARGAVTALVAGNTMRIDYTMTNGMKVQQVLTCSADGRTVSNAMKIRKFGIRVATLAETIRKV